MRFLHDAKAGSVAVEFALIAPVVLAMTLGGCAIAEYLMAGRRVALACHSLVDLTSRYTAISETDMSNILNASTKVLAQLSPSAATLRVSEISTDSTGRIAHVAWSKGSNTAGLPIGSNYDLPSSMQAPNSSYVLGEVTYLFTPPVAFNGLGPFRTSAKLYMTPRSVGSIAYGGQ